MNYLDKYIITNKNSKCYGEYAYLVVMPNEDGRAKFLVNHHEAGYYRPCFVYLKMSSVDFVSKRLKDGFRFNKNGRSYEIVRINYQHTSYRAKCDEVWWEQTAMTTDGILNDIFLFKLDHFGNIWVYKYSDGTWIQDTQISGIQVHDNLYDDMISRNDRNIKNVLLQNNINQIQRIVNSFEIYTTTFFIPTIEKSEDIFNKMIDEVVEEK